MVYGHLEIPKRNKTIKGRDEMCETFSKKIKDINIRENRDFTITAKKPRDQNFGSTISDVTVCHDFCLRL